MSEVRVHLNKRVLETELLLINAGEGNVCLDFMLILNVSLI